MNLMSWAKAVFSGLVIVGAYFYGLNDGKNSEEFKNAKAEIFMLNTKLAAFELESETLSTNLAELRIAESRSRDDLEWMRQQVANIEQRAKTDCDRKFARCLRLATKGKELLDRADSVIEFYSKRKSGSKSD